MALPQNFEPEQSGPGKYIVSKLRSGEKVKFRILSDFITGKSVWGDNDEGHRVCTRVKDGQNIPVGAVGVNKFTGKPENVKQFIAAVVWNYSTEQLEIFETDKSTIIGQLFEMESNEDWGDSKGYDLTLSKKGEMMETTYSLLPSNKADFECTEDFKSINLEALYDGDDPFDTNVKKKSEDIITKKPTSEEISEQIPF